MSEELNYFIYLKALFTTNPKITKFNILRETIFSDEGLFRYKIHYSNGNILEAYQKFQLQSQHIVPIKYSFHLQNKDNILIKRWDNAPHHPELENFPNHIHETEDIVIPGQIITLEDVLSIIEQNYS